MAPLSRQLVGLVLPYDTFGSHLNTAKKTVNLALEKQNFAAAGKVLAEVWNGTVIDGHPVSAVYVDPIEKEDVLFYPSEAWRFKHVRQSQYSLQISKCNDKTCCKPRRSPNLLKDRFLPPIVPFIRTSNGFEIDEEKGRFFTLTERMVMESFVPAGTVMDSYCPSVKSQVKSRTCHCGYYSASMKSNKDHKQSYCCTEDIVESEEEEEITEDDDAEEDVMIMENNDYHEFPVLNFDNENNHSIRFLPN